MTFSAALCNGSGLLASDLAFSRSRTVHQMSSLPLEAASSPPLLLSLFSYGQRVHAGRVLWEFLRVCVFIVVVACVLCGSQVFSVLVLLVCLRFICRLLSALQYHIDFTTLVKLNFTSEPCVMIPAE